MLWWSVPLTRRQWHSGSCDVRGFTCCILLGAAASRYNSTVCPTRYRTRHFFNKFTTNEQLGTLQPHATDTSLFISHTTNVFLFKFRCNIFIGVRIIKKMPGSAASGTHCILQLFHCLATSFDLRGHHQANSYKKNNNPIAYSTNVIFL